MSAKFLLEIVCAAAVTILILGFLAMGLGALIMSCDSPASHCFDSLR
jgi:hypothetical protein